MSGKAASAGSGGGRAALVDESLEISRLVVDFLNAAYAARNDLDQDGEEDTPGSATRSAREAMPNLSPHAVRAAIHIHQQGEQSIGQLAAGLGISYGWASRVVDELEASRHVIRERDPRDHRVVRIRLDPSAVRSVERAYRWREQDVLEALRPLSEDEREAVRKFLRSVTDRLRQALGDKPESATRA
jgi:DNA-binding MarR family transcriptional regulator